MISVLMGDLFLEHAAGLFPNGLAAAFYKSPTTTSMAGKLMLTRYDRFLIVGLVAIALLSLLVIRYRARGVDTVVVQVDGKKVFRAPLTDDAHLSADGPLGKTHIEIKEGRVRVIDSPCRRKTCVHTGWIDKAYQTIVCMPNRVVIHLIGGDDSDRIDGITG